ncbi:MAG: UvrD-helicase domain-containing protein [Bacteroidaceae bacterium]|nr:UvrD-helicase domain-containing protein [Bacteroidaceae bacterium]
MIDYQQELNPSQRDAVLYTDGDCMVIAGAGSGKTRVLTYRIAHLLEEGVDPWAILALTFTNKAAGEMKQRIAARVGESRARYLWMGTFHSIFSRILRTEADRIGYSSNFTIYDQTDSQNLIKSIVREMQLDEKTYKPSVVQNRISNAKNRLITASAYVSNADIYKHDQFKRIPMTGKIYERYEQRCRQSDAMDFDDLLLNTFILFRDNADVLEKYGKGFRHILVDEYQDTNYAQHCIVWQLTRNGAKVCVVGDDAQSIYSFRGANLDNMLKFSKLYPDSKLFKLEQNYRSTQTIVEAAGTLISKNHAQIPKNVFSENEPGDKIKVLCAHSDLEESEMVVNRLLDLHTFKDVPWREMAILYRTNAQSRPLEEALRKRGLPYKIYGGLSFYQRKEIKDVIAYFRMSVNPNDEEAFKRIINYPARGIGQTTLGKIQSIAMDSGVSLWSVLCDPAGYALDVNSGTAAKLAAFRSMLESFQADASKVDAQQLAGRIVEESGIMRELRADSTVEGESRRQNVEELLANITQFCVDRKEEGNEHCLMTDYLSDVSLMTDQDNETDEDMEKVTLMTVHAAKGLEFDAVFIVGLEENLFPSDMSGDDERQIEEERRLFYVAMTRARKHLTLLFATTRFKYGNMDFCTPSRFLKDIDARYLSATVPLGTVPFGTVSSTSAPKTVFTRKTVPNGTVPNGTTFTRKTVPNGTVPNGTARKPWQQGNFQVVTESMLKNTAPSSSQGLHEGNVIEHERFGIGNVLSVEGSGDNAKARIRFLNVGEKTLLLKFARYKILK